MSGLLSKLGNASWRGIAFPIIGVRDFGFAHDQEKHRFIFRDEQLIESIGRQNPAYRYKIPFIETLRQDGWKELFTSVYPKFLAACLDRSGGLLRDPIHGPVRCKLASLQESMDVDHSLDGVVVSAEFIFSPEQTDDVASSFAEIAKSLPKLQESAFVYGSTISNLTPAQQQYLAEVTRESTTSKLGFLASIQASANQVQKTGDLIRAQLSGAMGEFENTRTAVEGALDPKLDVIRRDAGRMALSAREVARTFEVRPGTKRVRVASDTTRLGFCVKTRITVDQLIQCNPQLVSIAMIKAGTVLLVPTTNG